MNTLTHDSFFETAYLMKACPLMLVPPTLHNEPKTCLAMGKGYPSVTTNIERYLMGEYASCSGDFDYLTLGGV